MLVVFPFYKLCEKKDLKIFYNTFLIKINFLFLQNIIIPEILLKHGQTRKYIFMREK